MDAVTVDLLHEPMRERCSDFIVFAYTHPGSMFRFRRNFVLKVTVLGYFSTDPNKIFYELSKMQSFL